MEHYNAFLSRFFKEKEFKVYSLAGDASNRRYYRVLQDQQSWVLMSWEPFEAKNYPFLSVLKHFSQHKVQVPQVVDMSEQEGLVLLEDLGDLTLERKFWESQSQESSVDFYKQALDELVKIHFLASKDRNDCTAFQVQFDTEKLLWEMNYGKTNLLEGICKFKFTEPTQSEISKVFHEICLKLHQQPKYIAHRDYHSRNLMIKFDKIRVIDFQDARLGPIQYDLVSLMRDSYVNLNEDIERKLLNYYLEKSFDFLPKGFSQGQFDLIYEIQTIQRCFKACGSFASFYQTRGDTRYLKYISHTLKRVIKSLQLFPEYLPFVHVLYDSGALDKKYDGL